MKSNKTYDIIGKEHKNRVMKEDAVFWGLFLLMAVYYGYRLFCLTPWYDELYTYYCFISKGPIYAAIHWPLPNNHVGYSALSGILDYCGNSYIGLRGLSYIAALANIRILYLIMKKFVKGWLPVCTVILYVSMNLVNQMAVQGRGYTLGITCYLIALFCLIKICEEEKPSKLIYWGYVLGLTLGLYAVSSHIYWVVPLCLAGGIFLLTESLKAGKEENVFFLKTHKGKRLIQLILASFAAAILTIGLYAIIWVSIGSNLLVKDAQSSFFGMGHVAMILKAPFAAIARGMEYMLDTPYIQSEERAGFVGRLGSFFVSLSGYYYSSIKWIVLGIFIFGIIYLGYLLLKSRKQKTDITNLLYTFLLTGILFVPICLLIQCKRPYYRVFTYGGVLLAILIGVLLEKGLSRLKERGLAAKKKQIVDYIVLLLVMVLGIKCLAFSGYNGQYSMSEYYIQDALEHGNVENRNNLCVTDCNQQYLLYFLYGIRCENQVVEGSDLLLLDKRMTDPEFDEMIWEFYQYYSTLPWDYIENNMEQIYENEGYVLYAVQP